MWSDTLDVPNSVPHEALFLRLPPCHAARREGGGREGEVQDQALAHEVALRKDKLYRRLGIFPNHKNPPLKEPKLHSDRSLEITLNCLLYDVYTHDSLF